MPHCVCHWHRLRVAIWYSDGVWHCHRDCKQREHCDPISVDDACSQRDDYSLSEHDIYGITGCVAICEWQCLCLPQWQRYCQRHCQRSPLSTRALLQCVAASQHTHYLC